MATKAYNLYRRFKPHLLMILTQIGYTFVNFITAAAFKYGLNPNVYVTYRYLIGGVVTFPFAYFLERKQRPKMTLALFAEIFILSFLGIGLAPNMYFWGLNYMSTTFVTSMFNTIAALTFVIAVVLRLEALDLRNPRGVAKILGTLVSLIGVSTMTLYKGHVIQNLWQPLIHIHGKRNSNDENRLKGSILAVASCIAWSMWYTMQAFTLKRYPAQLSLTTWMSFVGAAQSAIFTAIVEHRKAAWTIGFNIDFWSVLYSGVVVAGLIVYVQLWCTNEKGPVFVTMFTPLSSILVAVLAYFVLGEDLYLGRVLGAFTVIIGLYLLLWGKDGDQHVQYKSEERTDSDYVEQKEPKIHVVASTDSKTSPPEP